ENRSGDAAHPEFRPQVAERDQGGARRDGPASGHGSAGLAAGEYRRSRQALRRPILSKGMDGRLAISLAGHDRSYECVTVIKAASSTAPPRIARRCGAT